MLMRLFQTLDMATSLRRKTLDAASQGPHTWTRLGRIAQIGIRQGDCEQRRLPACQLCRRDVEMVARGRFSSLNRINDTLFGTS